MPRILVYVVHYFGSGSEFQGRSTRSEAADRRTKVERVIKTITSSPFDVEVSVCGIPDAALVPVDVDLSGSVEDPRHLVYAAIESLVERVDEGFDYYMCVEDDILVPAETIGRMVRFRERARVNEVLLPNRLEQSGDAADFCVDLMLVPGWQGLRRKFEGERLDVGRNPHSGLAFLSREQIHYARRRVNFGRRDQFLGGPMASAFANLHLPFLLWRTRGDLGAHHVVHLDRWESPGATFSIAGQQLGVAPEHARGMVDEVRFEGVVAKVRGWLAYPNGNGAVPTAISVGGRDVAGATFSRHERPDVPANAPGVEDCCGFLASFSLLELTAAETESPVVSLRVDDILLRASWPGGPALSARDGAPAIPDSPHMPRMAEERLRTLLADARCYLEYGTGGSTLMAARLGVPLSYCVESDESWLVTLKHRLRDVPSDSRQVLIHADIGPTAEWGYPATIPPDTSASDYALAVWDRMASDDAHPDTVLIDGRYRVACLFATLLHARPETRVLFDDYRDRPHYEVVEAVIAPTRSHDRVVEFVIPETFDRELAWRLLARYAGDAR